MRRLRRFATRILPRVLSRRIGSFAWRALDLEFETPSGLTCRLCNRSDWLAFQEIFVRRDYEPAVQEALRRHGQGDQFFVFDLGANIGLFCLYLLDRALTRNMRPSSLRIACVEGSPSTHKRLSRNMEAWRGVVPRIDAIHGLAGRRSGSARISDDWSHLGNRVILEGQGGVVVPYVDLEGLCQGHTQIDLLKCDIEGSERELLTECSSILERARILAIEFHGDPPDQETARDRVLEQGFTLLEGGRRPGEEGSGPSLEIYVRPT